MEGGKDKSKIGASGIEGFTGLSRYRADDPKEMLELLGDIGRRVGRRETILVRPSGDNFMMIEHGESGGSEPEDGE